MRRSSLAMQLAVTNTDDREDHFARLMIAERTRAHPWIIDELRDMARRRMVNFSDRAYWTAQQYGDLLVSLQAKPAMMSMGERVQAGREGEVAHMLLIARSKRGHLAKQLQDKVWIRCGSEDSDLFGLVFSALRPSLTITKDKSRRQMADIVQALGRTLDVIADDVSHLIAHTASVN